MMEPGLALLFPRFHISGIGVLQLSRQPWTDYQLAVKKLQMQQKINDW
jgi:hypothetical protein